VPARIEVSPRSVHGRATVELRALVFFGRADPTQRQPAEAALRLAAARR
jgi:hypothetical protein